MSDFKLGIVRLGRVAGKVSWIQQGLPCAAGGVGPRGPLDGARLAVTHRRLVLRRFDKGTR